MSRPQDERFPEPHNRPMLEPDWFTQEAALPFGIRADELPKPESREAAPADMNAGRPWIERVLDPRSLQIMMLAGGGLLLTGLVIWLWSIGIFENRLVLAAGLGTANLALIAAGGALFRWTRYEVAGRGLALLGSLALPLNLWFYDAQSLITLRDGGHLWVPALGCCVIYAGLVRWFKDPWFVYTLVAGVVMTGLLVLADQRVDRFWEILAPAAWLIGVGVLCIHLERAFPVFGSTFRRDTFGRSAFSAGQVTLAFGLALLACGRLTGWFYEFLPVAWEWSVLPSVSQRSTGQWIAILLTSVACYAYGFSHSVASRGGRYLAAMMLTFLWTEFLILDLFRWTTHEEWLLLAASIQGLLLLLGVRLQNRLSDETAVRLNQAGSFVLQIASVAGLLLTFSRLVGDGIGWSHVGLALSQGAIAWSAASLCRSLGHRGLLRTLSGLHLLIGTVAFTSLSAWTIWHRLEGLSLLAGGLLLVAGHLGRIRETDEPTPLVSFQLWLGSLLVAVPILTGLLAQRLWGIAPGWGWVMWHEVGTLAIGLALLAAGVLGRIRCTSLIGTLTLATYVTSLLAIVQFPEQLQSVSVYLMIGGGAFFLFAVMLSVYRDRLLAMPARIQKGEGVFGVLTWR